MKLVFFDFDGVILNSMPIKTEAFGELFAHYGEEVRRQVVEYHVANGGVSRYEKFRYYYREILCEEVSEEHLSELGVRFTELTMDMILSADFIPGAEAVLADLKEKGIPAVVASGAPQSDLDQVIANRGLGDCFVEAHGSPKAKADTVREVCDRFGIEADRCVFVGDAMNDFNAALSLPMPFLGVESPDVRFPDGTLVVSELSASALYDAEKVFHERKE